MQGQQTPSATGEQWADLVLEGGGVRGIALVGALSVLTEHGYRPHRVAGTSAGAIVATLLGAGYTTAELTDIIARQNFSSFKQADWEDHIPLFGTGLSVLLDQGMYDGEYLLGWMRSLLSAKGIHTFRDLTCAPDSADPLFRYKVQVIASDITTRRLLVLPRDASALGIAPDDLEVALAVRMSMSIPIFFKPVRFHNPVSGQEHLIVDGGILSNFPIWLFDWAGEPRWPAFGLRLVEPEPALHLTARLAPLAHHHAGPREVLHFLRGLIETMLEAHDRLYLEQQSYARTIAIPTLGTHSTDFGLSREQAQALYQSGRDAAAQFLSTWSFERYLKAFRHGRRRSRREEVAEQMRIATAAPVPGAESDPRRDDAAQPIGETAPAWGDGMA